MEVTIAILALAFIIQSFRVVMLKHDIKQLKIRIRVLDHISRND